MTIGDTYRCENCGGEFQMTWTDEEADAEMRKRFPHLSEAELANPAIICDECDQKLWAWYQRTRGNNV